MDNESGFLNANIELEVRRKMEIEIFIFKSIHLISFLREVSFIKRKGLFIANIFNDLFPISQKMQNKKTIFFFVYPFSNILFKICISKKIIEIFSSKKMQSQYTYYKIIIVSSRVIN